MIRKQNSLTADKQKVSVVWLKPQHYLKPKLNPDRSPDFLHIYESLPAEPQGKPIYEDRER